MHIDIAPDLSSNVSAGAHASVSLKSVFDKVRASLDQKPSQADSQRLIILDDIATLEWIGIPVLELVRFTRALCALCRKANAALVLRHHIVTPGEPDDLLRRLLQLCTYHMDVLPLSSGKSGSVALHAGPATINTPFRLVPRHGAVHYKLSDAGAVFFDRGTGGGVL
ncbi:predicted protein [Postia placenta Mad-698-R]|nr:predicted protein [Postia placenta Mad-698-R]